MIMNVKIDFFLFTHMYLICVNYIKFINMCGISGLLYNASSYDDDKYDSMLIDFFNSSRQISHRGPDRSFMIHLQHPCEFIINFERLSINDLSTNGDQPFTYYSEEENAKRAIYVTCNGEIYNHKIIKQKYLFNTNSKSDCEVILSLYLHLVPTYDKFNNNYHYICNELSNTLDGEFAVSIIDANLDTGDYNFILVNDKFGIRPLFVGILHDRIYYASELKGLPLNAEPGINVNRFPPRHYGVMQKSNGKFCSDINYHEYYSLPSYDEFMVINKNNNYDMNIINSLLSNAVYNRMESDRPIGFLLSGGLDSSLVSALGAKYLKQFGKTARTFSIGLENGTDHIYAVKAATYIGSEHTHITVTQDDFLDVIPEVINTIGSFDITTIRASCGQYIVSKYISQNTDIKVLLVGDGSDELLGGYKYEKFAPSDKEFHNDCIKLLNNIHCFDGLRADRCISHFGIEARLPFLDSTFVEYILTNGNVSDRRPSFNNLEKSIVRLAFKNDNLLPDDILFRVKEAFSDGVSSTENSWHKIIQDDVEIKISDEEFFKFLENGKQNNIHCIPLTKEAYYFRKIFIESFTDNVTVSQTIPYYWLPNFCGNVNEPCARIL